jgi:hypothetical protein
MTGSTPQAAQVRQIAFFPLDSLEQIQYWRLLFAGAHLLENSEALLGVQIRHGAA